MKKREYYDEESEMKIAEEKSKELEKWGKKRGPKVYGKGSNLTRPKKKRKR